MFRTALPAALLALGLASTPVGAETTYRELPLDDGTVLRYALVLPEDFDPERAYPTLLALPPGMQNEQMVEAGLGRYWGAQAAEHGWIVASPVAPGGVSFFHGSERHIPRLLEALRAELRLEGDGFHLAGASNGGRSAFRIALEYSEEFLSLTVLPGYPPSAEDAGRLENLAEIPARLLVGGDDVQWVAQMRETVARLEELGGDVTLEIFPDEGHVPPSLDGGAMMERLEALRAKVGDASADAVATVLDTFHTAAAEADGERYFSTLASDAIFLGTDPGERWTLEEFRGFAEPYFKRDQGWTYTVAERHVSLAPDGRIAWFDEALDNAKYGRCRGTGVLALDGEGWRIVQYSLSIPIPNELAVDVVARIRGNSHGEGESPVTRADD